MRYLAVVCNADAMHSSQRIMQTTNSRDNRQTSEWKGEWDTRCINGNKLFRRDTRGERLKANFTRPSIIDFQGMPGILLQDSHQREKAARATRHVDESRNLYHVERTREISQKRCKLHQRGFHDRIEILKIRVIYNSDKDVTKVTKFELSLYS